jgi:NADPH-dependent curcumin reductase CurA
MMIIELQMSTRNMPSLVAKRIRRQELDTADHLTGATCCRRFMEQMADCLREGTATYVEDITELLDSAPPAIVWMF